MTKLPVVTYENGVRTVIGEVCINDDGTFEADVHTDEKLSFLLNTPSGHYTLPGV